MIRQILLFFIFSLLITVHSFGQDPIFSQFYAAPIQINPGFTGHSNAPYLALNYRNQWPSFNAYVTYAASFDQFFEGINSGVGLMVITDNAGDGILKTTRISGLYSYRVQFSDDLYLKLGVEGSFVQTLLDWDQLLFPDQIDPEFGSVSPGGTPFPTDENRPDDLSSNYFDISTGILLYSKTLYGGVSLKHLNTPNNGFLEGGRNLNNGLPLRLTVHGGAQINLGSRRRPRGNTDAFISPNVLFVKQGDFGQLNVGTYAGAGLIFGGLWYRHAFTNADAAIALIGVRKGIFKIGYSYDLTLSNLAGDSGGSHEISLTLNFEKPRAKDYNDCLRMFR